MKSAGDAPSPDPQIGKAALWQAKTGKQWLNFAKDAFKVSTERQADLDKKVSRVVEAIGLGGGGRAAMGAA